MNPKFVYFFLIGIFLLSCKKDPALIYDEETQQKEILTKEGIDSVLASFESLQYTELRSKYREYSDPDGGFYNQLKNKTYLIVRGDDIYKYVVGRCRIGDFVAADKYRHANMHDVEANYEQYWLVDKEMLYMILEFMWKLDELGYDMYGFRVRESHRHPLCNAIRGGASKSQHINGTAADLVIQDVNRDGEENQTDKEICLEILEELVGDRGGMGLYPNTMTIHIDSRGYRARWDSHKSDPKFY